MKTYPTINDPFWKQFSDSIRAYYNYGALVDGYSSGRVTSLPHTDYAQHAKDVAERKA